jgi:hypothetical protein
MPPAPQAMLPRPAPEQGGWVILHVEIAPANDEFATARIVGARRADYFLADKALATRELIRCFGKCTQAWLVGLWHPSRTTDARHGDSVWRKQRFVFAHPGEFRHFVNHCVTRRWPRWNEQRARLTRPRVVPPHQGPAFGYANQNSTADISPANQVHPGL